MASPCHRIIVNAVCVYEQSSVVAIVVPEVEAIKEWAREQDIPGTLSVLCANPHVKQLIMDDITNLGKAAGLKSFEQVLLSYVWELWNQIL